MQKAYKLLIAATIVSSSFGLNHQVSAQSDTYQVVSTSYEKPLTIFETYIGNKKIETVRYALKGADRLHDGLLYSSYHNRVINLKNSKTTIKQIEPVTMRIKKYKNVYYVMSLSTINQFALSKYTLDFKKIGATKRYTGFGKDLIVTGDKLYVLADHMKGIDYSIKLHTFDPTSLKPLQHETIKELIYADYIRLAGSQLKIYGTSPKNDNKLTILSYDTKKQHSTKTMTSNQYVKGGVEKTQMLSRETELIFNMDCFFEINHRTKQARLLYNNDHDLIDYTYDSKTKTYHVLELVTQTGKYQVKTLNSHFKPIATYRLKSSDSVSPFRVL
ncbi:hypothetical protein Exig_1467 [Exiguobacterium sibiricum 255-15]|uniref:Uncharacterized protein n=1 Tax=Exiguobacterium sibiricum (strain DSM 17290 / CCUG 55495 / CIP 109462 / JCM 13490 / 255-15) TaxID=262543 RepID=B1YG01_EXIS2|nr:hypothetical protein [Exiguobacterium sibiricum]ACB60928.1 hypothetical protein Exig_1467 [Exiguobacterium sibiricum 255-15]